MRIPRCLAVAVLWIAAAATFTTPVKGEAPLAIVGLVLSPDRQPLPEVFVEAKAEGFVQRVQTDAEGRFRIEVPKAGSYEVTTSLEGFDPVVFVAKIPVADVSRPAFEVTMDYATTCGYPVLDEPRLTGPSAISREEAEHLPLARDPWSLLASSPGVLLDRENVAGVEDGKQPTFVLSGTGPETSTWIFEGVTITDPAALGGSPTIYDFGALGEVGIRAGGADAGLATAGATIELTSRQGGNDWRGSVRYLAADGDWQSGTGASSGDLASAGAWNLGHDQESFAPAGRVESVHEMGLEGGGPLSRDHLWLWGGWAREDADTLGLEGHPQAIDLEVWSAKVTAQLGSSYLTGFFHRGEKEHDGRGESTIRPGPAAWRQEGPTEIWKLEDSHLFTPNFYLAGLVSQVDAGFELDPRGGGVGDPAALNAVRGPDGAWRHSFLFYSTERPQEQAKLDGAVFLGASEHRHELRFGAGLREAEARSSSVWPGAQLVGLADVEYAPGVYAGFIATENEVANRVESTSLYASDIYTRNKLTASAGLRYDRQQGRQLATTIDPVRLGLGSFGGGSAPEQGSGFEWESLLPRLSIAYDLGSTYSTFLKASYGRFADPLGTAVAGFTNPAAAQRFGFLWFDLDGDLELTEDEVDFLIFSAASPLALESFDRVDPGLDPPLTDELTLTFEKTFSRRLLIGASVTARRVTGVLEREALVYDGFTGATRPHRREDYEPVPGPTVVVPLPDGSTASQVLYRLRPGVLPTGGLALENGDREQEYQGLTLFAQARDLGNLQLRAQATFGDWQWKVPESEREDPTVLVPGAFDDGGAVLVPAADTERRDAYLSARWSYDVSGVYAVMPNRNWDLSVGARLHGREGYPLPYYRTVDTGDGLGPRQVLLTGEADRLRLDDLHLLDLRVEKTFEIGLADLALSLDAFNVASSTTVLQRSAELGTASGDFVREVVNPRALRLGVRLSY